MRVFHRSFLCASASMLLAMGFGTTVRADYTSAVEALNPLCYYQFNDASSANGATCASTVNSTTYNGTYFTGTGGAGVTLGSGMAGLGNAGYFTNGALNSMAAMSYVKAPTTGLPSGSSARTIVFWVEALSNSTGAYHGVFQMGTSGVGHDCAAYTIADSGNLGVGNYGYTEGCVTGNLNGSPPTVTGWHMFAVTMDPTGAPADTANWTMYWDGVPTLANENPVPTITVLNAINSIGASNVGDGGWGGGIDEFAVFDRVLTGNEITGLYNAVPEPTTLALLGMGLLGLLVCAWRKRK